MHVEINKNEIILEIPFISLSAPALETCSFSVHSINGTEMTVIVPKEKQLRSLYSGRVVICEGYILLAIWLPWFSSIFSSKTFSLRFPSSIHLHENIISYMFSLPFIYDKNFSSMIFSRSFSRPFISCPVDLFLIRWYVLFINIEYRIRYILRRWN